jgi:type II secretory pathway pseudopilin PulG
MIDLLTLIVSLLAVIISLVSLVRTRRVSERQLQLQAKQEELAQAQLVLAQADRLEKSKANLVVSLQARSKGHRFFVVNQATVPARNVQFVLCPAAGKKSPLTNDFPKVIPATVLPPGQEVTFIAAISYDTGTTFDCTWSWENPDGTREKRSSVVTLS